MSENLAHINSYVFFLNFRCMRFQVLGLEGIEPHFSVCLLNNLWLSYNKGHVKFFQHFYSHKKCATFQIHISTQGSSTFYASTFYPKRCQCLLEFCAMAASKVISGEVPDCDSAYSYSSGFIVLHDWETRLPVPRPDIPLSHIIQTLSQPVIAVS